MTTTAADRPGSARRSASVALVVLCSGLATGPAQSLNAESTAPSTAAAQYEQHIRPILETHCFECHGYGSEEGGMSLDPEVVDDAFLANSQLWWKVLKNVRAGVMPPPGSDAPDEAQQAQIANWIKGSVFGIDPHNIDPGPASVRRLNRFEYGNTIRDLMGIDFNVEILFPPDDSGFGFDNVGDAQTLSPMLVEKYLQAAQAIVAEAVPQQTRVLQYQEIRGRDFRNEDRSRNGERMSVDDAVTVSHTFKLDEPGLYRVALDCMVHGSFGFHPRRTTVTFSIDGEQRSKEEHGWKERFKIEPVFDEQFDAGEHTLTFQLEPVQPEGEEEEDMEDFFREETNAHYYIHSVKVEGPVDPPVWQHPPRYKRFFTRDEPPQADDERRAYAEEVLRRFTKTAFRRPAEDATVQRLVDLAEDVYTQPDKTFEAGVAHAMVAVLASPRFLLLSDFPDPGASAETYPLVDEYSLASRLSYYFWSTMPDEELLDLADRGQLRQNLDAQVERLLNDERSDSMIRSFVGQWLRARDVEHVSIDALAALGLRDEFDELASEFRRRFRRGRGRRDRQRRDEEQSPEDAARAQEFRQRFGELREIRESFNAEVREAMRRETELTFEHILRENRSSLELIDSDYTFLNARLAEYYGVEGVRGRRMRKVALPEDSPRGGVLTQGTMLTVTSNPTRTSPVKRGLFILDNLLGTPPPPPPPDIPELEESADKFGDREPTLREVLEIHRESPLCASCHARMDPLGLALENFNALGTWRDEESGQAIDASGELVSGETFTNVQQLKEILVTTQRENFYRCLTEKMLTYALGRGLDYYDVETVDRIVAELEQHEGRLGVVLRGIVHSAPFQRQRAVAAGQKLSATNNQ